MFNLSNKSAKDSKVMTRRIAADRLTPVKILSQMGLKVLLESADTVQGKSRYSIIVLKEAFTIYKNDNKYFLKDYSGKEYLIKGKSGGFLGILKEFRNRAPEDKSLYDFPLPLGGVGYLGYEFFNEIEEVVFSRSRDDRGLYESAFMFGRTFLIFDHLYDEAIIAAVKYDGEIVDVDLEGEIDRIENRIREILTEKFDDPIFEEKESRVIVDPDDKENYMGIVKIVKDEIIKGNLFQCVPSRRIEINTELSPVVAYRNLRMKNPSPYMLYLDFNDFIIFGASPEVMVKVKNGKVTVRPIAGTRKRGKTREEDLALENELTNDVKEKAEHLMLVDLGRNDVGRVSTGGSVRVVDEMVVERYSKVMHLVSQVEGKLASGLTTEDAIKATFPAGTVSGAPKIQAVKTIDRLESFRRGPYAGLVGYFEKDGSFDSCIVIRCAVYKNGKIWLQAGAGIVYDSDPEKEFEETENKAAALMTALGIKIKTGE